MLLLLASIVCFVVGIISPATFRSWFGQGINRGRIALIFGGLIIASSVLTGAYASPNESEPAVKPEPTSTISAPASVPEEKKPTIEVKEETKTEEIVFDTANKNDSTLGKGQTKIQQEGKNGAKETKYEVTYTDGNETDRKIISENITVHPITKIVLVGTKVVTVSPPPVQTPNPTPPQTPVSNCDPNYSGACVPIASDVDCAGGSGNGPAYVKGPVYVIGVDIYDLDRDGNGVGCEN